jgi:hypothetical protein
MNPRISILVLVMLCAGCREAAPRKITEPIPDLPANQQRAISRNDFRWQWPLTIGSGTLGCTSGAVVLRSGGVTYALNDTAKARGFTGVQTIQSTVGRAPSKPLARITQDERTKIFAAAAACGDGQSGSAAATCRRRLAEARGLSADELSQIEVEGTERRWRPLTPEYRSVAPLVEEGLKLCTPGS